MTTPHRFHIEGHIYYITSVTQGRLHLFTEPAYIIPLIDSLNFYRYRYSFKLMGFVIMPDHLHLLMWPQGAPESMSDMMRDYKHFTSGRIARQAELEGKDDWVAAFRCAGEETQRAERKVWQDSFWEQTIYSKHFLRQKLNYIHRNPVRLGLVANPGDYPYSSYRNYVTGDETLIQIDKDWM